jgi:hypothetical protein
MDAVFEHYLNTRGFVGLCFVRCVERLQQLVALHSFSALELCHLRLARWFAEQNGVRLAAWLGLLVAQRCLALPASERLQPQHYANIISPHEMKIVI